MIPFNILQSNQTERKTAFVASEMAALGEKTKYGLEVEK